MEIIKKNDTKAEAIYNGIMTAYGTDSGCLFGLGPNNSGVVLSIIQFTIDALKEEEEEG